MQVSSVRKDEEMQRTSSQLTQSGAVSFSQVLEASVKNTAQAKTAEHATAAQQDMRASKLAVGTISSRTPTVSHLLRNDPAWKTAAWRIIHAEVNRDKPFTTLRPGTTVYVDVETQEISWENDTKSGMRSPAAALAGERQPAAHSITAPRHRPASPTPFASPAATASLKQGHTTPEEVPRKPPTEISPTLIRLGTISPHTPTVSHLLKQDAMYGKEVWNIISAASNRQKDFTHMRPGTTVFMHPETREISWHEEPIRHRAAETPASSLAGPHDDDHIKASFAADLAEAVKPLYGTSYKRIDCYGLLVRGMKELGIRYQGKGGMRDQLVQMAVDRGLPENAYLNGEGLIEVSGSRLYTKRIGTSGQLDTLSQQVFREMEPLLEDGQILAFSTRTRGHTGIISRNNGVWTFINSGVMDNSINPPISGWGVGEEVLREEITNWLHLAANRNESLHITLGRLDEAKLRTAFQAAPENTSDIL